MTEREQFEAWAKSKGAPKDGWWVRQIDDGGYSCHAVDMAWEAWQAARAQPAQAVPVLTDDELLTMWSGDTPRPTLGKNKVLAYGRQVEQAVRPKMGVAVPMTDEARKLRSLLGAALGALRYHTEQTRPIQRTKETIQAIEHELGGIVSEKGGA